MKMKKALAIGLLCMLTIGSVQAQSSSTNSTDYKTALGVKFYPGGITLKHFMNKNAVEGIAYFNWGGLRITGLYELHYNIEGVPGLQWYVGPGAHLGFYDKKHYDGVAIGVDGVLGLDYKINNAPLNLSLDWQPSFEFGDGRGFYGGWGGLAIRYTF